MIWGYYNDPLTTEYVYLGSAHLEDGGTADCYVRYGKLPLEILRKIAENAQEEYVSPVKAGEGYYYDYE